MSVDPASMLPLLYAGDHSYGWSQGMRAVTHALLADATLSDVSLPDGAVVEVGCGGGQLLGELQQYFPRRTVIGVDLHPLALAHAQRGLPKESALVQSALPALPWADDELALIVALDVFDQRGIELVTALAESYRLLGKGGALLMRVSAHPRLYGAHDVAFHTGQRYTRQQVQSALLQTGFVVQRITYANALLALPVAAMRLAQRWGVVGWTPAPYEQSSLHGVAAALLQQEAKWLHHDDLPWGLSLCAVARKP